MPAPRYRFVLGSRTAYDTLADITHISYQRQGTYRLNRPAVWTLTVPTDQPEVYELYGDGLPNLCKGRTLRVYRTSSLGDEQIVFNGIIISVAYSGNKQTASAMVTAIDPSYWWARRYMRDSTGNLGSPLTGYGLGPLSGGEILGIALSNSKTFDGGLMLDIVSGETTNSIDDRDMLGIVDSSFPKTIADLSTFLTNTGELDVVIQPIDTWEGAGFEPGIAGGANDQTIVGRLHAVTTYGNDLPSTSFDYGQGAHNVDEIVYTDSMETLANKLWFYLGNRISENPLRFAGGNIVHDDPGLQVAPYLATQQVIESLVTDSRERYGVWHEIQYYDTYRRSMRGLFETLWQMEILMRVNGRALLELTPTAEVSPFPFEDYYLGDIPRVNTNGQKLGIELSGLEARVYGFDVSPDNEGVERLGKLTLSTNGEGPTESA